MTERQISDDVHVRVWRSPDGAAIRYQFVDEGPFYEVRFEHGGEVRVDSVPEDWVELLDEGAG